MSQLAFAPVVVRSAFRSGGLAGVVVRPSRRSPSGVILVCAFRSVALAGRFAARWAAHLGVACSVRPLARPGRPLLWSVSVPVADCVPFLDSSFGPCAWRVCGLRSVSGVAASVSLALL